MLMISGIIIVYLIVSIVLSTLETASMANLKEERESNARWNSEDSDEKVINEDEIAKEIKDSMRPIKKAVYGVLTVITVVIAIFNSFFITDEQETAFTMTFGHTTMVEEPGFHFKFPFITKCYKGDARTQGMSVGYDIESNESQNEDSLMITSDFNFVNTDFYIEYRISNLIEYVFGSNDPVGILRNIAQASIRNTVGLYNVDSVITTGKGEIEAVVKDTIIRELQQHATGLTIVNVTIQDAEPPTAEVNAAFKEVENAKQNAETAVNNAKKSENEKIPNAEAQADQIVKAAEATKTERINQATQEVAEFKALYNEYSQNPVTVKKQLYYSTMEEILPNMEIIIGNDSKVIYVKNGEQVTAQAVQ